NSPTDIGQVLTRVLAIAAESYDPRYEHPRDASLAGYLWLLSVKHEGMARTAAEVVSSLPNTWWCRKVARLVLAKLDAWSPFTETKSLTVYSSRFYISTDSSHESPVTSVKLADGRIGVFVAPRAMRDDGVIADLQPALPTAQTLFRRWARVLTNRSEA